MGGGNRGSGVIEIQSSQVHCHCLIWSWHRWMVTKPKFIPIHIRGDPIYFLLWRAFIAWLHGLLGAWGKKHLLAKSFSAAETLNGSRWWSNREASDRQPNKTETLQIAQVKEMQLARKKPKYGKPHLQQTDEMDKTVSRLFTDSQAHSSSYLETQARKLNLDSSILEAETCKIHVGSLSTSFVFLSLQNIWCYYHVSLISFAPQYSMLVLFLSLGKNKNLAQYLFGMLTQSHHQMHHLDFPRNGLLHRWCYLHCLAGMLPASTSLLPARGPELAGSFQQLPEEWMEHQMVMTKK